MPTYRVGELARNGAPYALALLLQHIRDNDEPFVTYRSVADLLEKKLKIPQIFSVHVGYVAGGMMDEILEIEPEAPLINALITRPTGIPGDRFAGYYNRHWRSSGGRKWKALDRAKKLLEVAEIRAAVRDYDGWERIYRELYERDIPKLVKRKKLTEKDGKPPENGRRFGRGESEEHQRLKEWAKDNPTELGLPAAMIGENEASLLSGDRIDVLFSRGNRFVAVEVKSIWSGHDDWQRGIYQCVKYREVLKAQELPASAKVECLLLTEEDLPADLRTRARLLGVKTKVHKLNKQKIES